MYQAFEAIIDHGQIKFTEPTKLPRSGRVYVMVVNDEYEMSAADWKGAMLSLKAQRKQKKVKKYSNLKDAVSHLNDLMKNS